ncbi:MAG TPA: hypothetical protein VFD41_00565 [Actinomycetales bacterium]|nr:hypothetical protein [Actinomycetales bacterium]
MSVLKRRLATLRRSSDRGDVPGWVLVTLMTAGLVIGLWAVAGDALENVFTEAMNRVLNF